MDTILNFNVNGFYKLGSECLIGLKILVELNISKNKSIYII